MSISAVSALIITGDHSVVGSASDSRSRGRKLEFQLCHITFEEIDTESFLRISLPPLILEGQLSFIGERMYKKYCLTVWRTKPKRKSVCRLNDQLAMTLTVLNGPLN